MATVSGRQGSVRRDGGVVHAGAEIRMAAAGFGVEQQLRQAMRMTAGQVILQGERPAGIRENVELVRLVFFPSKVNPCSWVSSCGKSRCALRSLSSLVGFGGTGLSRVRAEEAGSEVVSRMDWGEGEEWRLQLRFNGQCG